MVRGLFIFFVFIWKPSIWRMIRKKYPRFSKFFEFPAKICCRLSERDLAMDNSEMAPMNSLVVDQSVTLRRQSTGSSIHRVSININIRDTSL